MTRRCVLLQSCAVAVLTLASPCVAQNTAASSDGSGGEVELGDIVVTATRQAQRLQDVPIAVSQFDQRDLRRQQLNGPADLQFRIPNFTFTNTDFGSDNVAIRGIGRTALTTGTDSGVGIHLNGAYIDQIGVTAQLFDIERLEVARGPQGTLYGRNTTAGAINLITHGVDPELSAGAEMDLANYGGRRLDAFLNVPITGTLGIRLAGRYQGRNGFIRNLNTGRDVDGRDDWAIRATLEWAPSDRLRAVLMGSYYQEQSSRTAAAKQLCNRDPIGNYGCLPGNLGFGVPNGLATLGVNLAALAGLYPVGFDSYANSRNPSSYRSYSADFDPSYTANFGYVTLNVDYDFDDITLTSITGYNRSKIVNTGSPTSFVASEAFSGGATAPLSDARVEGLASSLDGAIVGDYDRVVNGLVSPLRNEQVTQEVHLASQFKGRVNFLVGGFYSWSNSPNSVKITTNGGDALAAALASTPDALLPPYFYQQTRRSSIETLAAFGEVYYRVTDQLRLTGGLRWTRDRRSISDRQLYLNPLPVDAANPPFRTASAPFTLVTGKAGVDWTPDVAFTDQTLIYASFSRGGRSGGFNPAFDATLAENAGLPDRFRAEQIDAFEIGTKNLLLGRKLTANITGFYYDYRNLQLSRQINRSEIIDNVAAEIWGVEGEFAARPTARLSLNLNLAYLATRIKSGAFIDPADRADGDSSLLVLKDATTGGNCVIRRDVAAGIPSDPADPGGPTLAEQPFTVCELLRDGVRQSFIVEGLSAVEAEQQTAAIIGIGKAANIAGRRLPNSSRWSVNAGAQYDYPISPSLSLSARIDYSWRGPSFARVFNTANDRIGAISRLDASLQIASPDQRWYARAYIQNLFDRDTITGKSVADATNGLAVNVFTLEPRRAGVVLGARF